MCCSVFHEPSNVLEELYMEVFEEAIVLVVFANERCAKSWLLLRIGGVELVIAHTTQ